MLLDHHCPSQKNLCVLHLSRRIGFMFRPHHGLGSKLIHHRCSAKTLRVVLNKNNLFMLQTEWRKSLHVAPQRANRIFISASSWARRWQLNQSSALSKNMWSDVRLHFTKQKSEPQSGSFRWKCASGKKNGMSIYVYASFLLSFIVVYQVGVSGN